MYYEMMEQPEALRRTYASESENMANISKLAESVDTIYLIGCGSSISTCYSIRDALASVSDLRKSTTTSGRCGVAWPSPPSATSLSLRG